MQFAIDSLSGDVSLVKPLDYESVRSYRLVIRAQDGGSPSRSNTTQLLVNVKDVNDNAPRFYTSLFQESVSENVPVGFSIVRVQAYDADEGVNAELTYTLSDKDYSGNHEIPITVDSRSGWVYTSGPLDRETQAKYQLQVTATDGGTPPKSATASVVVVVQDVNDNDPVFSPAQYDVELAEDEPPGTPVVTVTATDADEDNKLHYEITGGNTRGRFSIASQNGRGLITVSQPLDFKQERRFVLTVTATDSGGRSDTAMVNINITDANNYAPVFENAPYTASVFEDAPIGTTVLVVSATDSDVGVNAQITYTLSSEISNEAMPHHDQEFSINPQTGAITTNKLLDRETMSGYLLTVTARDGGVPSLSDTTDVEISVVDVNDNEPVFKQQIYSASIMEDALVGTSVIQVSATDADVGLNGRVHYELDSKDREEGSFVIDPASGVIRTNKALDRESVATYDLKALAIDGGTPPMSSTVIVHIKIEDINDSPPVFESDCLTFYIPENSPIGTTVGEIYAHDPDEGPNAVVHYSIKGGDDSASFSLETRQGSDRAELVTMVDLDYESPRKKYELIIRAASPPLWNDVRVEILVTDVNDNAPMMKDFQIIFNNYKDCFPVGPFGRVPAYDADVTDKLQYRILSGNNANLVLLNETTGSMTLSPQLNTNVPKLATMEISVSDGVNEVKAMMQLSVRLITEEMLFNSITVRLNDMSAEQFLSPLLSFFIDGLAAIIPCPKENVYVFSVQDDTDVTGNILNVSFSARRPDAEIGVAGDNSPFYSPTHLRERVYLHRTTLARLATVQVLPFDDNVCVHEPCLNYEECLTVLKFGNASGFITSDTVLFRPIYPVTTFTCQCPQGFTGNYLTTCHSGFITSDTVLFRPIYPVTTFTCQCPQGFTGNYLTTCHSSPASSPATQCCSDPSTRSPRSPASARKGSQSGFITSDTVLFRPIYPVTTFTCQCPQGFTGNYLTTCHSGFITSDTVLFRPIYPVTTFTCQCPQGFTGNYLTTCHSGFITSDTVLFRPIYPVTTFTCQCPQGFTGNYLTTCHSGFITSDTVLFRPIYPVTTFTCQCPQGFTGNYLTTCHSGFITSDTVLFRPIYPVTTFTCQCPQGFTGSREHYMCDTEVDLCYSSPCVNNGTCLRREGGYTCVCAPGFTGVNCETILTKASCNINGDGSICRGGSQCVARREGGILCQGCTIDAAYTTSMCELRARSFPVSSFLTFPGLKRRHRFHLKLKFATQATSGLLLYNGRYNERHDFLALEIINSGAGRHNGPGIRFTFALGGAKTEVTVEGKVADGNWHTVEVEYFNRTATMILDDCDKALSLAGAADFGIKYACANFSRKVLPPRCDIPTETCHSLFTFFISSGWPYFTMILDDCDKALSLAGAADFGIKYACANFSRKVLPPRCDIPTETCHRYVTRNAERNAAIVTPIFLQTGQNGTENPRYPEVYIDLGISCKTIPVDGALPRVSGQDTLT
ncbi:cadherin domain-containing protein [Phthorimaea operculella]|nr:cadherin domain-containing protein [Phthorimaea operculella]